MRKVGIASGWWLVKSGQRLAHSRGPFYSFSPDHFAANERGGELCTDSVRVPGGDGEDEAEAMLKARYISSSAIPPFARISAKVGGTSHARRSMRAPRPSGRTQGRLGGSSGFGQVTGDRWRLA